MSLWLNNLLSYVEKHEEGFCPECGSANIAVSRERPFFSDAEIAEARKYSTTMFMKEKIQRQFLLL